MINDLVVRNPQEPSQRILPASFELVASAPCLEKSVGCEVFYLLTWATKQTIDIAEDNGMGGVE